MVMVILLVLFFRVLEQPRRRLRHRGHRRDVHRHLPARRRPVLAVELEAVARGCRCSPSSSSSTSPISRANLIKVPDGGWFPLLVGLFAFTLLTTWARGRQLMIKRMNEAAMPAEIFIKSAAEQRHPRARHRRVHDHRVRRHPARAAPQSQAQQGAARAGDAAHREDRGRALCRGADDASSSRSSARASTG